MELFDDRVVLFESDEGGEYLLVTCEPSGMGGLVVRQAAEAGADPRSGYADVLSPAPLNERAPSNGSFFVMHDLLGRVS